MEKAPGFIPRPDVVFSEVTGVNYSVILKDDAKRIAPFRIWDPRSLDELGNPVIGGLYDRHLGPNGEDDTSVCPTCKLAGMDCPGHCGHIELGLPVYSPLFFDHMFKLIKSICFNCFALKIGHEAAERFIVRLKLIGDNRIPEALAMSMRDPEKMNKELARLIAGPDGLPPPPPVNVDNELKQTNKKKVYYKAIDSIQKYCMEDTVKLVFSESMKATKCQQCGIVCNKMKQLQKAKLFMAPVNEGEILSNKRAFIKGYMRYQGRKEYIKESWIRKQEEEMRRAKPDEEQEKKKQAGGQDSKADIKLDQKMNMKGDMKEDPAAEVLMEEDMLAPPDGDSDFEDAFIDQRMNEYFYVSPLEVEYVIKKCWQTEASGKLLRYIYWSQNTRRRNCSALDQKNGYQQFFIHNVLVAPNIFRPIQEMDGSKFAHFHNTNLEAIQHFNLEVDSGLKQISSDFLSDDEKAESLLSLIGRWIKLQYAVNQFIDNSTIARPEISGIKQFLEKKEGLFRRNMMGKRVNMAARSTISPDVYIAPGEVGIPPMFAEELSIAEGVTSVNLSHLQNLVKRGPRQYPGAVGVEDQEGNVINLFSTPKTERLSLSKTLLSEASTSKGDGEGRKGPNKAVFRQLTNGDYMLTNRQPTLHKPSLMCHSIRVLRGDRTIRLHYANCGTFNADFDGDEMNLHCPQDHGARAEMRHLMHADHQYIVPTSGGPIRTLIQDHVISSVWMTSRGRFFDREQFDQLLFFACSPANPKVSLRFEIPPPVVIYPKALWTGKQLIASMVKMMCPGNYPITFMGKAKTSNSFWGEDKWTQDLKWTKSGKKKKKKKHAEEVVLKAPPPLPTEDKVCFRNGEYLYGTFDKSMYGGFGLVHSAQCIYGNKTAGRLLGACSRLFTLFLQSQGHTTGYQDVILLKQAEDKRKEILKTAETVAIEKSAELVDVPFDAKADWDIQLAIKKVVERKLRDRYLQMPAFPATHDQKISGVMGKISSSVIRACLPDFVQRKFPHNGMVVMTSTGAKGSSVNTSQISCLLGQQELEGRRVPRMASGKTLPCFLPYDAGARSGGFIGDRYLTGLRPQEYYYHCMAGRDGLVDTTVKTASSGYLQRCVIKIQEALYIAYDYTVRDIDDESIVLFYYGEDAVDVHKQTAIAKLDLVANNAERVAYSVGLDPECQHHDRNVDRVTRNMVECDLNAPLPLMSSRLPSQIGVVGEKFAKGLYKFVKEELPAIRKNRTKGQDVRKRGTRFDPLSDEGFKQLMYMKYMECLMPPGEAVGVLAGQSIGEPSTQMTLNTFHMAGRGEANVTLGIPRLREILMSATEAIKTPVMKIPLKQGTSDDVAHELYLSMNKSFLIQYVQNCEIKEWPYFDSAQTGQCQKFVILVQFFRPEQMVADLNIQWEEVIAAFKTFCKVVKKKASQMAEEDSAQITHVNLDGSGFEDLGSMPNADDDSAVPAKPQKVKEKDTDDGPMDEENEEFIEGKMRFCGGHGEAASYAAPDDDDKAFIKLVDQVDNEFDDDDDEGGESGGGKKKKGDVFHMDGFDDEFAVDDMFQGGDMNFMAAMGGSAHVQVGDDVSFVEDQMAWKMTATLFIKEPNQVVIEPIIEEAMISTVVRQIPKIDKVYISKAEDGNPPAMQTDGINFNAILGLSDIIDENKITCNNMIEMEHRYGIEAAKNTIMNEVSGVFSAYGIDVDPRHLKTISEKMTHSGKVRGCNRMAIAGSISPFLKASFETATKFIIEGALYRVCETMGNPAANIVVGRGMKMGTGACQVTIPVPTCNIPIISAEDREKLGIGAAEDPNANNDDEDGDESEYSDVEKCRVVESDETSSEDEEPNVQVNGQQQQNQQKQKM